jgi:hypothetical protein
VKPEPERPAKPKPARARTPRPVAAAAQEQAPLEQQERPAAKPKKPSERTPVLEDISSEWNGPMPSFLSKSAG